MQETPIYSLARTVGDADIENLACRAVAWAKAGPSPRSGIQPPLYFEYRNWGPARRVGSPKDNIEQGISNSRSY